EVEVAAILDLAQRGGEQPLLEAQLALVAEVLEVLEDLATHRLREIGARLLAAHERPRAQPDEGAQAGQVAREQLVDRHGIAAGGALEKWLHVIHGGAARTRGRGDASTCAAHRPR